ncbi:MAG TPA: hypothetical protein VJ846_09240, partial [Sphingomicrobium sp.]|nr:hypothetical protein [Sphingomicrobium sp.]
MAAPKLFRRVAPHFPGRSADTHESTTEVDRGDHVFGVLHDQLVGLGRDFQIVLPGAQLFLGAFQPGDIRRDAAERVCFPRRVAKWKFAGDVGVDAIRFGNAFFKVSGGAGSQR